MDHPDVSPGAKDAATLAKQDLGLFGRFRLRVAGLVFLVGMLLMPPELRKATGEMEVAPRDEAE